MYIKPEPLNDEDAENDDANDDEFGDVEQQNAALMYTSHRVNAYHSYLINSLHYFKVHRDNFIFQDLHKGLHYMNVFFFKLISDMGK